MMKTCAVFLFCFLLISISFAAEKQEADNLLLKEMAALDKAFKATLDAVILNQPGRVAPAYEEVEKIRKQMEQHILAGKKITLPKNQDLFKVFIRMDNRFHRDVEVLVEASVKGNMRTVQRQTYRLMQHCVKCHYLFRK